MSIELSYQPAVRLSYSVRVIGEIDSSKNPLLNRARVADTLVMQFTKSDNKSTESSALRKLNTTLTWVTDVTVLIGAMAYFNVPENTAHLWQNIGKVAEPAAVALFSIPGVPRLGALAPRAVPVSSPVATTYSSPPNSTAPPDPAIPPPLFAPAPVSTVPPVSFPAAEPVRYSRIKKGKGKPVLFAKRKLKGVPFYLTTIDLTDPESFMVIRLANQAPAANSEAQSHGHENFDAMVKRSAGAVVVNGTFFSKDEAERVMGNMVSEGKFLKYSRWENYGTTLALTEDNQPVMVTARSEGQPEWSDHWFSLTCGPRLVKDGEVWLLPEVEGFTDPHVLGIGPRAAIGYTKSKDKLYIVSFLCGLSLDREAQIMKELGCSDAMNLDGGASKGLAVNGKTLIKPGRPLTNVLVVYDHEHKAPKAVIESWNRFQEGERPSPPQT